MELPREILFRAKRWKQYDKNESWTYGVPLMNHLDECEMHTDYIVRLVYSETVGQYTGFTDKNGAKVFEGDIVRYNESICTARIGVVCFGDYKDSSEDIPYHRGFFINWLNDPFIRKELGFWTSERNIEIVGNIHENPELLEGKNDE